MNPYSRWAEHEDDNYLYLLIENGTPEETQWAIRQLLARWVEDLNGESPFQVTYGKMVVRSHAFDYPIMKKEQVSIKLQYPTWEVDNSTKTYASLGKNVPLPEGYTVPYTLPTWIPLAKDKLGWEEVKAFISEEALEVIVELFERYGEEGQEQVVPGGNASFYNFIDPEILDLWLRFWRPRAEEIQREALAAIGLAFEVPRLEGHVKMEIMGKLSSVVKVVYYWAGVLMKGQFTGIAKL